MLGDQQLVAGGAILVVCFSNHSGMTQYHFVIGASLAFASFATFQAIIMVVADVIRPNPVKKTWRFCWILFISIAVMLCNFISEDQHFLERTSGGHRHNASGTTSEHMAGHPRRY